METASEIWNGYVRFNLIWIFIAGLLIIFYRSREKASQYQSARRDMRMADYAYIFGEKGRRLFKANWSSAWPIGIWIVIFGTVVTILDVLLGSS